MVLFRASGVRSDDTQLEEVVGKDDALLYQALAAGLEELATAGAQRVYHARPNLITCGPPPKRCHHSHDRRCGAPPQRDPVPSIQPLGPHPHRERGEGRFLAVSAGVKSSKAKALATPDK
ncbi:Protein of unknown function [Gryllus bimaculatus]|nr:Protein of unknown function [Gryllus bimaculatus]